jgi:hypothetical protein
VKQLNLSISEDVCFNHFSVPLFFCTFFWKNRGFGKSLPNFSLHCQYYTAGILLIAMWRIPTFL